MTSVISGVWETDIRGQLGGRDPGGVISIEQARVHWIKKTLETRVWRDQVLSHLMSQTSHSHTQVGLFFPSPLPIHAIEYHRVSAISLNIIVYILTTLPQLHLANSPEAGMERRPEDCAIEEGVKEVLALSQAHRPKNTRRCYLPKQKEWKVERSALHSMMLLLAMLRD